MINSEKIAIKIKYEFLEFTERLQNKLSPKNSKDFFIHHNKIIFPFLIHTYKYRSDDFDAFFYMTGYFQYKNEEDQFPQFFARYLRPNELNEVRSIIDSTIVAKPKFSFHILTQNIIKTDLENTTIYQYYSFEDFANEYSFYYNFYDHPEITRKIISGEFFKETA